MSKSPILNRNNDNENISRKLQRSFQENFILISQVQSLKAQLKNKVSPVKNNNEISNTKQNESLKKTNAMIKGLVASNLKSGIMSCFWCLKSQSIKILSQSFNKWKNKSMLIALNQHYLNGNTSPPNKIISEHSLHETLSAITKVAEDTVHRSKKNIQTYNTIEKDRKIHLLLTAAHDIMKDNKVSSSSDLDVNVNLYNNFKNSNRSQSPVKSLSNSRSNSRDKSSKKHNKMSKYQQQQKQHRESHQKNYVNSENSRGRSRERNPNSLNKNLVASNNKIRSKIDVNKRISNIVARESVPSYLAPTCASRKKSVSPDKHKNDIYNNNILSLSNSVPTQANQKNTFYINDSESTNIDVDVIKEKSPIINNIPIKDNKIKVPAPGLFDFESFIKKDQQRHSPIEVSNNNNNSDNNSDNNNNLRKDDIEEGILILNGLNERNDDISQKYLSSVDNVDTFTGDLYNHTSSFDQFNSKSSSRSSRSLRSSRSVSPLTPYQTSLFSPDLKNRNIPAHQIRAIQDMDAKQYNLIYGNNVDQDIIAWQDDLRK
jgi:hypothetical protein